MATWDEKQHRPRGAQDYTTPFVFVTLDGMQAELLLSPRMYWKDNRVPCSGQPNESRVSALKPLRLIGVLRSMPCRQNRPLRLYRKAIENC